MLVSRIALSCGPSRRLLVSSAIRGRLWTGWGHVRVDFAQCHASAHMMGLGTPLTGICPQLGALIHTFGGLIHMGNRCGRPRKMGLSRGSGQAGS